MTVSRHRSIYASLLLFVTTAVWGATGVTTQCAAPTIDAATLDIASPCVLYDGQRYEAHLAPTVSASGYTWALDPRFVVGPANCAASVPYCAVLDSSFNLTFRDLLLSGTPYTLRLGALSTPSGNLAWSYRGHHVLRPSKNIGPACGASSGTQIISLVHVADLHGNFDLAQDKYSRIRAYVDRVRSENPYSIFTNAGDDHEKGSVAEVLSQGAAVSEVTAAMQFDVRTIGNHDFAWGEQHLLDFSRDAGGGMVLSTNTHYVGSNAAGLGSVDFGILEVGCLRVGFFGMATKPYNERDVQYDGDYLPSLRSTYDHVALARQIIDTHRGEVDVMVMVSHLGSFDDELVAASVPGIDLILGGHTHGGASARQVSNTLVIQPDFYANGVTRVDVDVNLGTRAVSSIRRTEQPVSELTEVNATVNQAISSVMARYAPNARTAVAYLENAQDIRGIVAIAARAGINQFGADAALLVDTDIFYIYEGWSAGAVSAQTFIGSYYIERQPSNTPGINSLYQVEVTGAELSRMIAQQPAWVYSGPAAPAAATTYKVLLNKGAALNPAVYFPSGVNPRNATFKSETWAALAGYGAARTASCLSLDTNTPPPPCRQQTTPTYSIWNFADAANPLRASTGPGALSYRDTTGSGWGARTTVFSTTDVLGLPPLNDGHHRVMAFPSTAPNEGYVLTHNEAANGAYAADGLISDYTIVMDVLWPGESDGRWRSLLQASTSNDDDADWFVNAAASGGIGIQSNYFGSIAPNRWYRIAMVARAADSGGTLQFYIDGQTAGAFSGANRRWALASTALLFTDNDNETARGYIANLMFAPYALSASDVQSLGGASGGV